MHAKLSLVAALAFATLGAIGQPSPPPLVPLMPNFYHFDHHWYEWMPKNPKYEAIESLVSDVPGGKPYVLVFFTERKAPKHQIFFTNDRASAASGFATYRDISYTRTGNVGDAQSVHIRLRDQDNAPIDWSITFPAGTKPSASQGGLTGQGGHSGSIFFMLFYREKGVQTTANHLRIGSTDYTLSAAQIAKLPFAPAYSSNIFLATLPYATSRIEWRNSALAVNGSVFKKTPEGHDVVDYVSEPFPGSSTTLRYDRGRLSSMTCEDDGHTFVTRFSPGLALDGSDAAFSVSFDGFTNLMQGTVAAASSKSGATLDWAISTSWAKGRHLRSTLVTSRDGYSLVFGE